jgi:thiosulfate dehydrogenase [quinone] large subunit
MIWKRSAAYALVRAVLGVVFLFNGVNKLTGGVETWTETLRQGMAETMLPPAMVSAFGAILPYLEISLGALLLIGLFTAEVLVATGALLIVLTFGTVLQASDASLVAHNVFYTVVVGMLLWLESANAWAIDRLRIREEMGEAPRRAEMLPPAPREPSRRWVAPSRPRMRSRVDQRS